MRLGRITARQKILLGLLVALLIFAGATIRLFLLPARDDPRHVDAIVVLGGSGNRVATGEKLVREGYSSTLLLSLGSVDDCPAIAHVRVLCFRPEPYTTQGEARYLNTAARKYDWKHVLVVSTTEQDTRARLRIKRCTKIDVAYVTTPESIGRLPYVIAYEWAALFKALIVQRQC
jgi:uncharacterized SAM-binding protein YcdF (DUF218 family)